MITSLSNGVELSGCNVLYYSGPENVVWSAAKPAREASRALTFVYHLPLYSQLSRSMKIIRFFHSLIAN